METVYIHIPFCSNICSYCDFAKVFYDKKWINDYLNNLEKEIGNNYKGEEIKTIYIGGGTPSSLSLEELEKLFEIIKIFKKHKKIEFTFESNIEDVTKDKLNLLKKFGVNRLSFGVQSFNDDKLKYLNRLHRKNDIKKTIQLSKEVGFENINVDLIYATPKDTMDILKKDIEEILNLDIPHISTYSLIIENNTFLGIKKESNIEDELDSEMYYFIKEKLEEKNYSHYEISNFAKVGFESKHNLTYWNNENYYGFGAGASGYTNNRRYNNTRSITKYIEGNYLQSEEKLSNEEQLSEEIMLGFRKIEGINIKKINKKYSINFLDDFKLYDSIEKGYLEINGTNVRIVDRYLYLSNEILLKIL